MNLFVHENRKSRLSLLLLLLVSAMATGKVQPKKIPQGVQTVGEYKFRWGRSRKDPNIALPFLIGFPDEKVERKVNTDLQYRLSDMGCDGKGESDVTTEIRVAERKVLNLIIHEDFFCDGAAHPTNRIDSMIYDLETGNVVSFEDLFTDYPKHKTELLKIFFIAQIDPRPNAPEYEGDDCPTRWTMNEVNNWKLTTSFKNRKIVVGPNFVHAIQACEFETEIPIEKLVKFAPKRGILARLAETK